MTRATVGDAVVNRVPEMLSTSEQLKIQDMIENASTEQLRQMRSDAEVILLTINSDQRLWTSQEHKFVNYAVEVLTRIDAKSTGGGWWYRTKRRPQIIAMYLG